MKISVEEKQEAIVISSVENKNIKFEFASDGSDLNNEKILMFLVKLTAQDDHELEISTQTPTLEVNFIIDLLTQFSKAIKEDNND